MGYPVCAVVGHSGPRCAEHDRTVQRPRCSRETDCARPC